LIREAMTDRVDQACDATEAVQASTGQIGDMGHAAKRHEVMRAHAVHGDAADHDHVTPRILEAFAKHIRWIELVAAEQPALPKFAHALRRAPGVRVVRRDAAGEQQITNRALEGDGVEIAATRNAY